MIRPSGPAKISMTLKAHSRVGIIAGAGEIPVYFAEKAFDDSVELVSIGLSKEIEIRLAPFSAAHYSIGIGRAGKIHETLKKEKVVDLIILGKVEKSLIFKPQLFDFQTVKFLAKLRNREDKTVMVALIEALEEEGFRVMDQRQCMPEAFPNAGILTQRAPSKKEMEDVEFGLPLARKVADLEIGQTIVVKNKTVAAVEGVEGTDKALERGCELAKRKAVAVKVSRTGQDYRYDCPGVGPATVQTLARGGASVLALEAGGVMVVEMEKTVALANEAGLSIVCV